MLPIAPSTEFTDNSLPSPSSLNFLLLIVNLRPVLHGSSNLDVNIHPLIRGPSLIEVKSIYILLVDLSTFVNLFNLGTVHL